MAGAVARIPIGSQIQQNGGKKAILVALSIISICIIGLAIFPYITTLSKLKTSDGLFFLFLILITFGGVSIANF